MARGAAAVFDPDSEEEEVKEEEEEKDREKEKLRKERLLRRVDDPKGPGP